MITKETTVIWVIWLRLLDVNVGSLSWGILLVKGHIGHTKYHDTVVASSWKFAILRNSVHDDLRTTSFLGVMDYEGVARTPSILRYAFRGRVTFKVKKLR